MTVQNDVIDTLVGILPGSRLDAVRTRRAVAREQAEASYRALLAPADPGDVSLVERFAIARFVAGLHAEPATAGFYADGLASAPAALGDAVAAAIAEARTEGPYGGYPAGPLSREDVAGPAYHVDMAIREALGGRLVAAFEHAHMLVFHPRDATPAPLQALLDAGWSTTGVVTLSQLVAFLAFQIRVVAGLRALSSHP